MGASLKIGQPFGIEIKVHWSFWLVVLWAGSEGVYWSGQWHGVAFAILAILLFFVCVLLHEFGHALVAKALGVEVKEIVLLPVGGMAKIGHMPEQGWQELVIALAGPMANLGIAAGLLIALLGLWGPELIVGFTQSAETVLSGMAQAVFEGGSALALTTFLIMTNLLLAGFNLLPAFPMDGGRILRAFLAMVTSYKMATRIAVRLGQVLALATIFFTLTPYFKTQSLGAVLIAVFVFVGATYEDKIVQARWRLNGVRVVDVMSAMTVLPASPRETLGAIMERVLKSPQLDLPVMVQGALVGMLRRDDLVLALRRGEAQRPVSEVMRTDYPSVLPTDNLRTVQQQMIVSQFTTLPVLNEDELVGLINIRDVHEKTPGRREA